MVDLYKELSKQAKTVTTLIDKELPNLVQLYEPVVELYTKYQEAMNTYQAYMASGWDASQAATIVVRRSNSPCKRLSAACANVRQKASSEKLKLPLVGL